MQKMLALLTIVIAVVLCSNMLFAQTTSKGDTLIIGPFNSQGEPQGALNEAIKADTNASGERVHKVYKLQPNVHYILTEVIQGDFPLVIVADEPDDENRPPVIRCGLKQDGSAVNRWYILYDDATFKNLWFSGVNLDGTGPIDWISLEINNSGNTITYEGCIMEFPYTWWATFADWGGDNVYKITDCIFQYIGNPTGTTWNGAIFQQANADSMIIRNSTFFDFGCFAAKGGFYTEIDHCSFVNCVVHPIDSHEHVIRKYTNNLFVNCHAFSDDFDEIKRHFDAEVKGLMNYAEIQWDPQKLDSLYGPGGYYGKQYDPDGDGTLIPEEQVWLLKNNNWFYTQPIKDYLAQFDYVVENPWMNNYNKAMFNSATETDTWHWDLKMYTWADSSGDIVDPYTSGASFDTLHIVDSTVTPQYHEPFKFFKEENTTNLDPGIVDMNDCDVSLAQNCINIRTEWAGGTVTDPVKWHNVADYLAFTWPLDYDLSYTNTTLENAATDGKPVGSLQWWDQYEYVADIESKSPQTPTKFTLEQNYPNPFNPTTTFSFSIPKSGKVTLEIFNLLGQKVATVIDKKMSAGSYTYDFNAANLASGIYFYRLNFANELHQSKKMILIK